MVTTAQVAHRLAPAMGVPDRTARRIAARLQDAAMLPQVAHGGARTRSPVLDHHQGITYAIGLATPGMVEQVAATVARILALPDPTGRTLLDTLSGLISHFGPTWFADSHLALTLTSFGPDIWATLTLSAPVEHGKTTTLESITFDSLTDIERQNRLVHLAGTADTGLSRDVTIRPTVWAAVAAILNTQK